MNRPAPSPVGQLLLANGGLMMAAFFWGSLFQVVELLLARWDPYSLSAARMAAAAVFILALLALREGWRALCPPGISWLRVWLSGTLGIGLFAFLLSFGVLHSGAVSAAIISASGPILAAFMSRAMFGEPVSARAMLGAAMAVTGALMVALAEADGRGGGFRGGELLVLLAMALFTWYSLVVPRWFHGHSPLSVTALTTAGGAFSAVLIWGGLAAAGITAVRIEATPADGAFILYMGLTGVALAIIFWNFGVRVVGVTVASIWANMSPVFTGLLALALGKALGPMQIAGGALILAGAVLAQLGRRRRA